MTAPKEAVYCGEKLFRYMNKLQSNIEDAITEENTITNLTHIQLSLLIEAEKNYLRNHRPTQQDLAFTQHGLPSTETLKADLEAICGLEEFKEVSEAYKRGTEAPEYTEVKYLPATKQDFEKELSRQDPKKILPKTGFKISQTENEEIFKLDVREETFRKGYDEYSRKYPLMIREGSVKYRVIWGDKLVSQHTESYYLPEQKAESMIIRPSSNSELAKTDPKKMKRIAQIEQRIKDLHSDIAHYKRNEIRYDSSLIRELDVSKFVLELEKTYTAYFRWRKSIDYDQIYYIYKKQFLDRKIAEFSYFDDGHLTLYDPQYLEVSEKLLPEFKNGAPEFKIGIS